MIKTVIASLIIAAIAALVLVTVAVLDSAIQGYAIQAVQLAATLQLKDSSDAYTAYKVSASLWGMISNTLKILFALVILTTCALEVLLLVRYVKSRKAKDSKEE